MSSEHWQQVEEIFQAALDLEPDERAPYLTRACGDDAGLRREVDKLLSQYEQAGDFIDGPLYDQSGISALAALMNRAGDPMRGRRVGAYRIEREIGRGGMGTVYEAVRADNEFRRRVAVKLVKRGMDTDFILRRFRRERRILATLEHPNIACLLDGGTTDDGLPFFVMEYIEGETLYRYSDARRLSIAERLRLFRPVCEAVHYAHEKHVVHRDLKPSNVLVTGEGAPKLLDFGIAKLLKPDSAYDTIDPTQTALRMMTPEYASPEQVRGESASPATDIYSLGVMLYELLTGHRPYHLKNRAMHEVARVICEQDPENLSVSLTRDDGLVPTGAREKTTLEFLFRARNSNLESLRRELSGDLNGVVFKALRKEAKDRYGTALELRDDITRHLEGRPVAAPRPAPPRAVTTRAAEDEEKSGEVSIAVLPFKMIGARGSEDTGDEYLGVGLADALITRLSNVRRLVLRPTSSVLGRDVNDDDPFGAGRALGVAYILDGNIRRVGERIRVTAQLLNVKDNSTRWSQSFDERFTDVLELEDSLSEKVAQSLIPRLTGEERKRLEKRGTNNPEAYEAYLRGRYFYNKFSGESLPKAVESYREAIRLDPRYAQPHVGIADYYAWSAIIGEMPSREAFPQAAAAARRALEIDPGLGEAYAILAFTTFLHDWDRAEGLRLVKKALDLSPNNPFAHECYSNFLASAGRFDEAITEIRRAEELDPRAPRAAVMTAWVLYQTRRFGEAVAKARQANEMEKDFPQGPLHLGNTLTAIGEAGEAVAILSESYRSWRGSGLPGYMLCFALVSAGRREDARKVLRELRAAYPTRHVKPYFLGMAHAALGERDKAFAWFGKAAEERNEWMIWFGTEPKLDALRDDPRYEELLRRTKNPLARSNEVKPAKPGAGGGAKSIAVLPLKLFGAATAADTDEFLGVGLADALVTRLSNVRRLTVRPTSSVLPFGDSQANPFEAGKRLGVDYVLDGNVRRAGERIRVTIQLLDVGETSSRWAETFDERFTDVLELEDSISEKVVKSLIPRLTGEEEKRLQKRGTNSPEAYEAYLRGRYHWNQFTPDALTKAFEAFQKAIKLDPRYALAHVGLCDFYIWANIYGMIPSGEALPLAEAAARRAVELDDRLGEAYASLGLTHQNRFGWAKAEELYRKSLELTPHYVNAHEWRAAQLVGHGRFDEGVEEMKTAERLDPLSLRTKTLTAWTLYQARRFDEALERGRQIVDLDENYPQGYSQIGFSLLAKGRAQEALPYFQKFDAMIPRSALAKYQLCFGLIAAGRRAEAEKVLEEMKALAAEGHVKPYFLGMAHAALGRRDEAFAHFEKAFAEDEPWMLWFGTEPLLDDLRDDPRYRNLLRRLDIPPATPGA